MIKILFSTLLEFEIKKEMTQYSKTKEIPQAVSKAIMQFGVLQHFIRPTEWLIFSSLRKMLRYEKCLIQTLIWFIIVNHIVLSQLRLHLQLDMRFLFRFRSTLHCEIFPLKQKALVAIANTYTTMKVGDINRETK